MRQVTRKQKCHYCPRFSCLLGQKITFFQFFINCLFCGIIVGDTTCANYKQWLLHRTKDVAIGRRFDLLPYNLWCLQHRRLDSQKPAGPWCICRSSRFDTSKAQFSSAGPFYRLTANLLISCGFSFHVSFLEFAKKWKLIPEQIAVNANEHTNSPGVVYLCGRGVRKSFCRYKTSLHDCKNPFILLPPTNPGLDLLSYLAIHVGQTSLLIKHMMLLGHFITACGAWFFLGPKS